MITQKNHIVLHCLLLSKNNKISIRKSLFTINDNNDIRVDHDSFCDGVPKANIIKIAILAVSVLFRQFPYFF